MTNGATTIKETNIALTSDLAKITVAVRTSECCPRKSGIIASANCWVTAERTITAHAKGSSKSASLTIENRNHVRKLHAAQQETTANMSSRIGSSGQGSRGDELVTTATTTASQVNANVTGAICDRRMTLECALTNQGNRRPPRRAAPPVGVRVDRVVRAHHR